MNARIVLVVSEFPKLSETFIVSKFLGLLEKGWDVHVVCGRSRKEDWLSITELNNRRDLRKRVHPSLPARPRGLALLLLPFALLRGLICAPASSLRYLLKGWRLFRFDILRRFYLDAELIRYHPALIHFEFGAIAPARMYLKELLSCKVAVSFRGYDLNFAGLENPMHYQAVWQYADALHLLGEDLWRRALKRGCPPDMRHVLIPPAIDTNFFSPPDRSADEIIGTPERRFRILSVGRLEWKKGYEHAFEAVRLLKNRGITCHYRVIGDGNYYEPLAFALHQMGLTDEVELLGAQPREVVRAQMAWADVFLHTSVTEGFCNAVVEAQSMALPVVASNAGGLAENVQDCFTGFIVPGRDAGAFCEKLAELSLDTTLRYNMGQAGRIRAQLSFQLDDQVMKLHAFYQDLLGR